MRRMLHRWQTRSWILNVQYTSQCSIATWEFYSHANRRYCARETGNAVKHVQHWRHGRVRSPHRRRGQKRPGEQSGSREGGGRAHVHIPQGRLVRLHQPGPGPLVAGRLAGEAHRHWRQRGGCVSWLRPLSATGQRPPHWKLGIELKTAKASNNEPCYVKIGYPELPAILNRIEFPLVMPLLFQSLTMGYLELGYLEHPTISNCSLLPLTQISPSYLELYYGLKTHSKHQSGSAVKAPPDKIYWKLTNVLTCSR